MAGAMLATLALAGCASDSDGVFVENPLYAVMYEVYDDVGSSSYLTLLDSLDGEFSARGAREFGGGRAFLQQYNGKLYIGLPSTPTVIRFSIDRGRLVEEESISFADYGFDGGQFDDWNVTFINDHKAYLMNFADGTTVIWDPTDMEILGDIPGPDELTRGDLSLEGSPAAVRDGLLFRTFNWVDYGTATYSTDFVLAVYDITTDELVELVPETRCPTPGNLVHTDEAGNIYFSNWVWPVAGAIMRDAPSPCVLRVAPNETVFDPSWSFVYGDVADGREGAMFTYLSDDQALFSVFHDENTSFDETTDPWSYVGSLNWEVWSVDLETEMGEPISGIPLNGGAFTPVDLGDGSLALLVPGGENEGYATQVFRVQDGQATAGIQFPGWSYQFAVLDPPPVAE